MKYMLAMFGDQAGMATQSQDWVRDMIRFMTTLNDELASSGELLYAEGLADAPLAKVVRRRGDEVFTTDGPYAESKESLAGFWLLEVESEERVIEIASRIVEWSEIVEVRQVMAGPPDEML